MAIRIEETFELTAPVEAVWRFLLDPQRVVTCLPGAELERVVDESHFEGRETGGGTARGRLTSRLRALPDGATEVCAEAEVDLTGRVMQVGRGMIQGVAKQLFAEFALRVRSELAAPADAPREPVAARDDSIPLLRVLLRSAWASLERLLARLFRRTPPRPDRRTPPTPEARP